MIPIAGDQITNDIAMALRTPTREAEDIKRKYGCALSQLADAEDVLDVAGSTTVPAASCRAARWPMSSSRASRNCSN